MVSPVTAWHDEHSNFNKLLAVLQTELDVFLRGGQPDFGLMLDIITYLRDFGDGWHHLREDEAFRKLAQYCPDRKLQLARLKQEHTVIAQAGEELRTLLEQAVNGDVTQRSRIEMAAATYLVYYGHHIAVEEEDILPMAAANLTDTDWDEVRKATAPRNEPLFAQEPEDRFRDLHRRIMQSISA